MAVVIDYPNAGDFLAHNPIKRAPMIDYVIVSTIASAVREQPEHSLAEVVLFVVYVVVAVAAIVTAASMRAARKGEVSAITIAAVAPCVYFLLMPFGVLTA